MNPDSARRYSTAARQNADDRAPPAPPLPPHFEQARIALNRVFGLGQKAADPARILANHRPPLTPDLTSRNAAASHRTGLHIRALAANPTGTHVVLAGHEIFKTVRVQAGYCAEDANIRAAIRSYDASASGQNLNSAVRIKDLVEIVDVAWGKDTYDRYIAAATQNGPIILYDLGRLGAEVARLFDHRRQVHRISCNPHTGHVMLSASQDGTIRIWDIRDAQHSVRTFRSRSSIPNQNDGIRDVKWSPTNSNEFIFGTDGGWIQKWDTAMLKTAKVKIAAHSTHCNSVDWHADGRHVLTASNDKSVRVWDIAGDTRSRQQPLFEIKTIDKVRCARWRPACQSVVPQDHGALQSTQLATSYAKNPAVHVWDFRRPHMPFLNVSCYTTAPTDILWHSRDLLWTVGKEGTFLQNDLKFCSKTIDSRNLQAAAISPLGDLNAFAQKRVQFVRSYEGEALRHDPKLDFSAQYSTSVQSQHGPDNDPSRDPTDDSIDNLFLSLVNGQKPVMTTRKDNRSTNGTVLSQQDSGEDRLINLLQSLDEHHAQRPEQTAIRGHLTSHAQRARLSHLAAKYKVRPFTHPITIQDLLHLDQAFLKNADHAQHVAAYRLAQSWRIVAHIVAHEMRNKAVQRRRLRLTTDADQTLLGTTDDAIRARTKKILNKAMKARDSKPPSPAVAPSRSPRERNLLAAPESSSNAPTPTARPIDASLGSAKHTGSSLTSVDSGSDLSLPPSHVSHLFSPKSKTQNSGNDTVKREMAKDTEVQTKFFAQPTRTRSVRRTQPRKILNLEPVSQQDDTAAHSSRHDSEESFGMFPSFPSSHFDSFSESMTGRSQLQSPDRPNGNGNVFSPISDSITTRVEQADSLARGSQPPNIATSLSRPYASSVPQRMHPRSYSDIESAKPDDPTSTSVRPAVPGSVGSNDMQTLAQHNQMSFDSEGFAQSVGKDAAPVINDSKESTAYPNGLAHDDLLRNSSKVESKPSVARDGELGNAATIGFMKPTINDLDNEPFHASDFLAKKGCKVAKKGCKDLMGVPVDMRQTLQSLIVYHTCNNIDAQSLTHLLLLLVPLLPETRSLSSAHTNATIESYVDALMALDFADRQITSVVSKSIAHLINAGIQPLQVESIFATYHEQLSTARLEYHAAFLRRLAYPTFPAIYEQGLKDNTMHLRCGSCKKPMQFAGSKTMRCENCEKQHLNCPICWSVHSPFASDNVSRVQHRPVDASGRQAHSTVTKTKLPREDKIIANAVSLLVTTSIGDEGTQIKPNAGALLYSSCLDCNHAAHAACLVEWHALSTLPAGKHSATQRPSHGMCPTPGCTCNCIRAVTPTAPPAKPLSRTESMDKERGVKDSSDPRSKSTASPLPRSMEKSGMASSPALHSPYAPTPARRLKRG